MSQLQQPQHGGRLHAAAEQYGIPLDQWLDLSTGINPRPWEPTTIPLDVWQRLPDSYAGLKAAAGDYYGVDMLPVPGSQWAIQILPSLFSRRRIWMPRQGYEEHAYHWHQQHHLRWYDRFTPELTADLQPDDIVVVINPNNPTGQQIAPSILLDLANRLETLKGTLLIDEAFVDAVPEQSVLNNSPSLPGNLIVLRSVGKFFGLAGLRLGFVYCSEPIANTLQLAMGPWAINHPAAYLGERFLKDHDWQHAARQQLLKSTQQLEQVLQKTFSQNCITGTPLFWTLQLDSPQASSLFDHCAQQGILLRLFEQWGKVRIGLTTETGVQRLASALRCWNF